MRGETKRIQRKAISRKLNCDEQVQSVCFFQELPLIKILMYMIYQVMFGNGLKAVGVNQLINRISIIPIGTENRSSVLIRSQ